MNQTKKDRTITFAQNDFAALMDKLGDLRSTLYEGCQGNPNEACLNASRILQQVSEILGKGIISNNA
ncbi:MAG: hypothetical protein MJ185_08370 [Treponema sp.]|nr:hypothetical protein [Treponema sp.]